MSAPLVSVVIPCRNEGDALGACLDALDAQGFPRERFEVIVVDGASSDGSRRHAEARDGVRLLHEEPRGPSAARNAGILHARGDIIAFTDADCVPMRDWIASVAQAFAEDASIAGVAGALRMPRATLIGRLEDNDARAHYRGFITSNVAYKRSALLDVGGFDESLCCAEDHDLAWRILDAGYRIVHDARPIVLHDPPEARAPLATYLRKQFWYARNDVPAHVRAIRRARGAGDARAGSARAERGFQDALVDAGCAAGLGAALVAPEAALAGLALASLRSARQVAHAARVADPGAARRGELPALIAIEAAKRLARGAGTLAGLAELSLPTRRARALGDPRVAPRLASPTRENEPGAGTATPLASSLLGLLA